MKRYLFAFLILTGSLAMLSCDDTVMHEKMLMPSKNYHPSNIDFTTLAHREIIYVPVYSDIYYRGGNSKILMTSTLSVRNTSRSDSMYLKYVDYYDSEGVLLRNYIKKPIVLTPLQSVEFIVEFEEKKGGPGANFLVEWGAKREGVKPIFQGIIVGQGSAFVTEGIVTEAKNDSIK
jgi:hypothetical protein